MAITQLYTAVPNDVITAARWNNEFGNIYNNGTAIAFPVTTSVSFAGFTVTFDAAGVTTLSTSAAQGFILTPGNKAGAPNTTGKFFDLVGATFQDTNTGASGTVAAFVGAAFQRPTLVASNALVTTTDAATVYIANSPLASTNETITNPWALWVDDGNVRFDGLLQVSGGVLGILTAGKPIGGLTYANSAGDAVNDITVAIGEAASDDAAASARRLMVLTSATTKQIDASWAV